MVNEKVELDIEFHFFFSEIPWIRNSVFLLWKII